MTAPKHRGMGERSYQHAARMPYLPEPRQWLWRFACHFLVRSLFEGGRFNLLYNIGGRLEKCYIVLHSIGSGWSKNIRLLRYIICERPLGLTMQVVNSWSLHHEFRHQNKKTTVYRLLVCSFSVASITDVMSIFRRQQRFFPLFLPAAANSALRKSTAPWSSILFIDLGRSVTLSV